MGKGRNGRCLHRAGSRWQSHRQAQGAVHCSVAGYSAVSAIHGHEFEHAAAGTDQFGGFGCHQRRRHRHPQRQSKPHQHEAGEVAQLSEGLHGSKCNPWFEARSRSHLKKQRKRCFSFLDAITCRAEGLRVTFCLQISSSQCTYIT